MLYWIILAPAPLQNCLIPPLAQTSFANDLMLLPLLELSYFWQWVLMQSTGMTQAVLQRQTRRLTKVRSEVVSSYSSLLLLQYLQTTSFRYYWLPKKLTQLTVCFNSTGSSPSKMVFNLPSWKQLGRPLYSGDVMSHTLTLSKGQIIADSIRAMMRPVATPARALELLQLLNRARNSDMKQTLRGHLQADLLITRIALTTKPEQKPLSPFFWQMVERAQPKLLFQDCIHVLAVSKGCSRGRETMPLSAPNIDISISLSLLLTTRLTDCSFYILQITPIKYYSQSKMIFLKLSSQQYQKSQIIFLRAYDHTFTHFNIRVGIPKPISIKHSHYQSTHQQHFHSTMNIVQSPHIEQQHQPHQHQQHAQEGKQIPHSQNLNEKVTIRSNSLRYLEKGVRAQFKLRRHSLKIAIKEEQQEQLQNLYPSQKEQVCLIVSKKSLPASVRKHFKSITDLYNFIYDNLRDTSLVHISPHQVTLRQRTNDTSNSYHEIKINLKDICEEARKGYTPNVEDMNDRLLQFSNSDLEMIESVHDYYFNSETGGENECLSKWRDYVRENDEEYFLEQQTKQLVDEKDYSQLLKRIEEGEKEIEDFQTKFPIFKKQLTLMSQTALSRPQEDRTNTGPANKQNGPFPPGYTPPHLAKQTAHDGLTSDQHLRFQANQSKKEKLKMAKQLLKMGFSTAEVIQKLQAQQRSGKSGYVDPVASSTTSSVRGAPIRPPANGPQPTQRPQQQNGAANKERAVREMLISLIRAKTFKKLDDIQRHMASQGVETTIQNLKRIIDEIKAKNAQRKAQQQKADE